VWRTSTSEHISRRGREAPPLSQTDTSSQRSLSPPVATVWTLHGIPAYRAHIFTGTTPTHPTCEVYSTISTPDSEVCYPGMSLRRASEPLTRATTQESVERGGAYRLAETIDALCTSIGNATATTARSPSTTDVRIVSDDEMFTRVIEAKLGCQSGINTVIAESSSKRCDTWSTK
jgi:hypothetical protein